METAMEKMSIYDLYTPQGGGGVSGPVPDSSVDPRDETRTTRTTPSKKKPVEFSDVDSIQAPGSLAQLIARLHDVFAHDDVCVEYVQKLMTSYHSDPKDWKQFAKFDEFKYTRNLVDEGNGKFNLMILCWNEAQGSSIHSHADAHCFMKVLSGSIKEEQYKWPCGDTTRRAENEEEEGEEGEEREAHSALRKKCEMKYSRNQCTYINDSIGLHRVENDSHTEKAITLHLYSPPFQECQCFDQRSGRVTTSTMTFWSKYGKRTPYGKFPDQTRCDVTAEDN